MPSERRWTVTGLTAILLLAGPLVAHGQGAPADTPSPENLLQQMSAELKQAGTFRFHAEIRWSRERRR